MKKYYCDDCGVELNEGEGSVFTCCETCWNKHYKKTDEQSEVRVEAKVKPACETLQIIDEMLREAYILKEHKDYIYNLDNAERLRGYKLALQRLKQKIVSK